jgi:ActR/RegA family two-component response regulator
MTGYSEFSNDDAIKEGAVGVFMKPIDFDQIISQIEVARGNS